MITNRIALTGIAVVIAAIGGCGDKPVAAPVNPEKARAALRTTLDAWKAGRTIESLAKDDPPIVAQDFDWMAGVKLDNYEVQGDGTPQDANLRIPVKLSLKGKGQKTVTYIVGTDIKLTVFRSME